MKNAVQIASDEALLSLDAIEGLAIFLNTLPASRRNILAWLATVIFGWLEEGGTILCAKGNDLVIGPDAIDEAHGDEPSCVWISAQRRRSNDRPKRCYRRSMLSRLQLYDAASQITMGRSIVAFSNLEGNEE